MKSILLSVLVAFLVTSSSSVFAMDNNEIAGIVEGKHRNMIMMLREGNSKTRTEFRKMIKEEFSSFIDYREMSKHSLKRYYDKLTDSQKKDYNRSFKRLVQASYLKRMRPGVSYDIMIQNPPVVKGDRAKVSTLIVDGENEFEVDHLLIVGTDGVWRIYDVIIDRVSMVRNYRKPLYQTMKNSGFKALLNRINEKALERESWSD